MMGDVGSGSRGREPADSGSQFSCSFLTLRNADAAEHSWLTQFLTDRGGLHSGGLDTIDAGTGARARWMCLSTVGRTRQKEGPLSNSQNPRDLGENLSGDSLTAMEKFHKARSLLQPATIRGRELPSIARRNR
ncbi:hypothetical protein R1flu_024392 [Riccia fluitans]|uniref:Uncharacterized protein n=1 Tax=Riccia fluitans TaxID=41844 RepID=A0ABD1XV71_9MARC